jgi:PTH1 family peptidyl-tRNA hydrolase
VAHVVVGLGNPGPKYRGTRHNVGQRVADRLAERLDAAWRESGDLLLARGRWRDEAVDLVKPQSFMNVSGPVVAGALRRLHGKARDLVLVYDDNDLALGMVRVRLKGSHGGHNGVRSVLAALGTSDLRRVTVGVGRPDHKDDVVDHVLTRIHGEELDIIDRAVEEAADAVLALVAGDPPPAAAGGAPETASTPPIYPPLHEGVVTFFRERRIAGWGHRGPSRSVVASQVACINHLEPARRDRALAVALARTLAPGAVDVVPVEDGFLTYRWIGGENYLGEPGWTSDGRGRGATALDALMAVAMADATRVLVGIEWTTSDVYPMGLSVATSRKGTSRLDLYRAALDDPDSPILHGDHARLFYEPFYRLMRQTLLLSRMTRHAEFGASTWRHVHVVPESNHELRTRVTSPALAGAGSMSAAWESALARPERYRIMTPGDVVADLPLGAEWTEWRQWLRERYGT